MKQLHLVGVFCLVVATPACLVSVDESLVEDGAVKRDGAASDQSKVDVHVPDGGAIDGPAPDGSAPDSSTSDGPAPDGSTSDGPAPDTVTPDTVTPDTLSPDTLSPDTLSPDTLSPDTLSPDTQVDGPPSDGGVAAPALLSEFGITGVGGQMVQHVAMGGDGNVYLFGKFYDQIVLDGTLITAATTRTADLFVVSFTADGQYRWGKTFGSDATEDAIALGIDGAGNVYAVGTFGWGGNVGTDRSIDFGGGVRNSQGYEDIFVVSYQSDGSYRWDRTFGGTSGDKALSADIAPDGSALMVGQTGEGIDFGGGAQIATSAEFVVRFDPGFTNPVYSTFDNNGPVSPLEARWRSDGGYLLTGYLVGSFDFGGGTLSSSTEPNWQCEEYLRYNQPPCPYLDDPVSEQFVVAYSNADAHQWQQLIRGRSNQWLTPLAVHTDDSWGVALSSGVSSVIGDEVTIGGDEKVGLAVFDKDGKYQWHYNVGATGMDIRLPAELVFDPRGRLLITGIFSGQADFGGGVRDKPYSSAYFVGYLAAYDSTGYLWDKTLGFQFQNNTTPRSVAVGSGSRIVWGGYAGSTGYDTWDAFVQVLGP